MATPLLNDRYRLVSSLGTGGMGEVFLADDVQLQRRVAIKFLHPESEHDALARERLRREALAAAALDHPFICKIHEIAEADGRLFVVMEFIDGETLHALCRRSLLSPRQIIEMANELAQALEEAHRSSVVHRDLKPANVMVTRQGHVKVMDFGLAKQSGTSAPTASGSAVVTTLTESGTRLGTPAYMSPEQVVGGAMDARSDIFSLGIVLYEMVTGAHPFLRGDAAETMAAVLRDRPQAGLRPLSSLPGVDALVGRMLAKAPGERFQSAAELRVELEALRERAWQPATAPAAGPATSQPFERTPFVARDAERTELTRLLDRMLAGQGGFALLGGEPGVGKTRLARELLRIAQERGCQCLTGHCYEQEGAPPFAPFIESMDEAVRAAPHDVRASLGDVASEIATIAPNLRRAFPDIAPPPELPADQRRRLVFDAFLEYTRRGAERAPRVLLLDDLHWADEPTLQLVGHLAPHLATTRVLVIGTYRDVELDVKRPFAKTLESLFRQRLATRVSLRRLSESAVEQMISAIAGSVPPSGLAKAVFRETEGNPFFVEEVYQHLVEEGKLFDESGRWRPDLRVDAIEVPEGVRLVIGRRLERLGDEASKALTAAAVIGRSFPLDVLEAVVDATPDGVVDLLEEAERAQLIASQPGVREARYEFVHELIRTTLISGLSLPKRQRLHLKIADSMERLRASSLDSHVSMLAHHLYQAGVAADVTRTAKFLILAARRAIAAGAFEEVLEATEHLIGLDLATDDPQLAEAFEHRGAALTGLQRPDEGIASLERAFDLHVQRRDDGGIAHAARALFITLAFQGRALDALAVCRRALRALSPEATRERALLVATSTSAALNEVSPDVALKDLHEAMRLAEELGDPALVGGILVSKATAYGMCGESEISLDAARQALQLLPPAQLVTRGGVLMNLLINSYLSGRFKDGAALAHEAILLAQRSGQYGLAAIASMCERVWTFLFEEGDLRGFLKSTPAAQLPEAFGLSLQPVAVRLHLGETTDAMSELRILVARPTPLLTVKGLAEAHFFSALAMTNQVDEARGAFASVEPWLPTDGTHNLFRAWAALESAVAGLSLLGDRERLRQLQPLTERSAELVTFVWFSPVAATTQVTAGIAAHATGMSDKAREHFETALRQADALPSRLMKPVARHWYARMLLDAQRPSEQARGHAMLEEALGDFRTMEMVTYANLAERRLRGD